MHLRDIVKAVGGEVLAGGSRANIPGPGHSPSDRSVSLWLNREGRLIVHCFAGDDWRAVLDDLRGRGLIDGTNRPTGHASQTAVVKPNEQEILNRFERVRIAERLWNAGRPIISTIAETYAYRRGIRRPMQEQSVVRFHPFAPIAVYANSRRTMPAMLVKICDPNGAFTAVEITYLTAQGRRTTNLKTPRKVVGWPPAGSAIRIDCPGEDLLVGEGYFTTLSASEEFSMPAWALMSTTNLRVWRPPLGVRRLLIAADRGRDGEASAEVLRAATVRLGVDVGIALPPAPFGDWNEALAPPDPLADRIEARNARERCSAHDH